jgi:hypothetical protein
MPAKSCLKPATPKAWAVLTKLQALAERGVAGERTAAQHKIDRLKARFDFSGSVPTETPDLFQGRFQGAGKARRICTFARAEFDLANAVKWAIENATGIHCLHRDGDLLAEASPATAKRLSAIAGHIATAFRALIAQFDQVAGPNLADRGAFVMGLYDGMMNEARDVGQPLPGRAPVKKKGRATRAVVNTGGGLHVHPYTLAVGLGRQIRFSVPLAEITAELDDAIRRALT